MQDTMEKKEGSNMTVMDYDGTSLKKRKTLNSKYEGEILHLPTDCATSASIASPQYSVQLCLLSKHLGSLFS